MRKTRWASGIVTIAVFASAGCAVDRAGGAAAEEVVTLTFAQPNDGAPPPQLQSWADQVDRLTDGTVAIEFQNAWRIGETEYEIGTLEDVRAGEVDLAWVGARALDRIGVTSFQALLAPLLVDSHELQRAVFEAGIPEEMLGAVSEAELVGVGVLPGPMRKVLGIDKPFVSPADFEGAVVGLQDSALAEESLRALGATAKAVPSSAELAGLDAYEQQLDSIAGNGYQDQASHLTENLNLWPRPLVIVAGPDAYDQLSEEQRDALHEASRAAMVDALVGAASSDRDTAAILCDSDLTMESVDEQGLEAFHTTLAPVYERLREDTASAEFLQRIEELKQELGSGPDAATCSGDAEAAGAIPNGTYRMAITPADIERSCEPDDPTRASFADMPPKGLTLELEVRGEQLVHSVFPTGEPDQKELGWTGTYRTYRDTIEILETGFAQPWSGTWSLEDGRLRIADLTDDYCETHLAWMAHPWVEVDDPES